MEDTPKKLFISDLNKHPSCNVWIQGTIEQSINNDILIISDNTGRAKITKCESADGVIDKKSLKKGTYCCIIGTVSSTKGIPEVQASKFLDLTSNTNLKLSWEYEVREVNLFLQGKLCPTT